jgi:hypothetical protein
MGISEKESIDPLENFKGGSSSSSLQNRGLHLGAFCPIQRATLRDRARHGGLRAGHRCFVSTSGFSMTLHDRVLRAPETGGANGGAGSGGAPSTTTVAMAPKAKDAGVTSGAPANGASADWRAGIADPKVREFAQRLESPAAAAKSAYELRTKLSSAIFKPGPHASEAERAAFRRALGVPDNPESYPLRQRDGVPAALYETDLAKARLGKVATILHRHDVRGEAMQELVDWYSAELATAAQSQLQRDHAYAEKTRAELQAEWGEHIERNIAAAARAQRELLGEEASAAFATLTLSDGTLVGDHPLVQRLLAGVGLRLAEDGAAGALSSYGNDTLAEQADHARARRDAALAAGAEAEASRWDSRERELLGRMHRR